MCEVIRALLKQRALYWCAGCDTLLPNNLYYTYLKCSYSVSNIPIPRGFYEIAAM
jgi:hypothetical protein